MLKTLFTTAVPGVSTTPDPKKNIGKCLVCGKDNVPLESVDVVIAGMSRKRTMCAECAAKYK